MPLKLLVVIYLQYMLQLTCYFSDASQTIGCNLSPVHATANM